MKSLIAAVRAYVDHPDRRVAAANGIALLVASNQPFYPLYVWWLIGQDAALVSLVTWFSTPFFVLVPQVARFSAVAGRLLLVAAGAGNTFVCAKVLGVQTGVELFLIPCALLAIFPFHRKEWAISAGLLGSGFFLYTVLHSRYGAPLVSLDTAQTSAFFWLHLYSVVGLLLYLVWAFSGVLRSVRE